MLPAPLLIHMLLTTMFMPDVILYDWAGTSEGPKRAWGG